MSLDDLRKAYALRYDQCLVKLRPKLEDHIWEVVREYPRVDRVVARAKDIERFMTKAAKQENGQAKYSDPLNQIQDQLAARIVTFYLSDAEAINGLIGDYYRSVEHKRIVPDSENEFGYEGWHHILFIPADLLTPDIPSESCPDFFELQVNTLFQHAWAEANHDLGYKPPSELASKERRMIAFTAAQAWGADTLFDQLGTRLLRGNTD
jgi:putative GTP pyrophosphokinase